VIFRGADTIESVAFSPDGLELAAGSDDNMIRLWDLRQPNPPPVVLKGHKDNVNSVAFSPDGARLASGSDDPTVRLWDLWTRAADLVCAAVKQNLSMEEWRLFVGEQTPISALAPICLQVPAPGRSR